MRETVNSCARGEDLVTYLYGEATPGEARDFEGHVRDCAACRTELASFGGVREAIGDWRRQALGALTQPAVGKEPSPLLDNVGTFAPGRASALAALRQFFALSTAWGRAATAGFALAFCALVAVAVAHFVERPRTVVVEKQVKSGYSREEVDAMIAEAIRRREGSGEKEQTTPVSIQQANVTKPIAVRRNGRERAGALPQTPKGVRGPRPAAHPPAELASADYLPFTAGEDEEELPTLADLVDDANQE